MFTFLFSRYLYLLVEVFIKVSIQSVLVMNLEEDEKILGVTVLFADSRINEGVKVSIKSSFMGKVFFYVHVAVVNCKAKRLLFGVNCRL